MARIYLSPSTQEHNAYAGGSNEETEMRHLAAAIAPLLPGHMVKIGGTTSAGDNVADSNRWKADYHVALHTNAGGGVGTEVWHFPGSKKGAALAKAIYERLAAATGSPDRGVKASADYIETRGPNAPAVIIEAAFHDNARDAAEIKSHHAEYAAAIAQGIIAAIDMGKADKTQPASPPARPSRPRPLLRLGSAGGAVATLQRELNAHGAKPRLIVDGHFGVVTRAAVEAFQKAKKLACDGVVGQKTWKALGL